MSVLDLPRLYTTGDLAGIFKVDPRTPGRWVGEGRVPQDFYFRTLGGHLRFYADKVDAFIAGGGQLP